MEKRLKLWRLETAARAASIPRSTLRSAVLAGRIPATRLADGTILVRLGDVLIWNECRSK